MSVEMSVDGAGMSASGVVDGTSAVPETVTCIFSASLFRRAICPPISSKTIGFPTGEVNSFLTVFPVTNPISLKRALKAPLPSMCDIITVSFVLTSLLPIYNYTACKITCKIRLMQYLIVVILLRIGIAVHATEQIIDSEVGHQDYGESEDHIAME